MTFNITALSLTCDLITLKRQWDNKVSVYSKQTLYNDRITIVIWHFIEVDIYGTRAPGLLEKGVITLWMNKIKCTVNILSVVETKNKRKIICLCQQSHLYININFKIVCVQCETNLVIFTVETTKLFQQPLIQINEELMCSINFECTYWLHKLILY